MTSTIKVNKHQNACGTNIIQRCGTTTTIGSGASNTLVMDGSAVTIGRCGGTVALASGASQTGFGRTGTVDWDTTPKTATFSAVSGNGYFCNTTAGVITVNLPAGVAGAIVSLADYAATWQTYNVTVAPNGTDKIGSLNSNATLNTEGQSVTFVFVDSTQGWVNTMDSTSNVRGRSFISATGGTVTTCGDFKIHTFTSPGTFCVSQISSVAAENTIGYLVVAGGGGGTDTRGGGGGAGGFREGRNVPIDNFTASPLVANAPTNAVTVTETSFPITVGGGGAGGNGGCGSNSVFSTITSASGGGGNAGNPGAGLPGGSGGGSEGRYSGSGGSGNTPPVSPSQGNNGGPATGAPGSPDIFAGGGGGGAGGSGSSNPSATQAGAGGNGVATSITSSSVTRAGGGGGGAGSSQPGTNSYGGAGGSGGGGAGRGSAQNPTAGIAGTVNTGGGGGGGGIDSPSCNGGGGAGGSGIVIIRYKFQ